MGYDPKKQTENIRKAVIPIVDLIEEGHDVVICHGNGPQVGLIDEAFENSKKHNDTPFMPLCECGAMSQGYIGYELEQALNNELRRRNIAKTCVTILSETLVDENDEAFEGPCKPIGRYCSLQEKLLLEKERGYLFKMIQGKGYRRLVASPKPRKILQTEAIAKLMKEHIVICGGGGGIPVIEKDGMLQGVDAVVDKDLSSALIASDIDADLLMILMEEDYVCLDFGKESQRDLKRVSVNELQAYLEEGQFPFGSMYPKVRACIDFVREDKEAIITSLDLALVSLTEDKGTHITK